MKTTDLKRQSRIRRKGHIRKKLGGTASRPRLAVFRSLKHIYAQIIDDDKGVTLVAASSMEQAVRDQAGEKHGKKDMALQVGRALAQKAKEKGVEKVAFDRGGYRYHGRVKALADGAREGGLDF